MIDERLLYSNLTQTVYYDIVKKDKFESIGVGLLDYFVNNGVKLGPVMDEYLKEHGLKAVVREIKDWYKNDNQEAKEMY